MASPVPAQKSALNVVMGAMTFGEPGTDGARVHDIKDVEAILDVFRSHGHTEIDTARVYAKGTSEEYLGKINWKDKGFKIETKLAPTKGRANVDPENEITHTPEGLRKYLQISLKALNADSLEIWYLHAPDRSVPYEVTLKAVNDLYKEGYFKRFGISNYAAWEVAEIVGICKANGYIQPTAYQGIYNAVHRAVEPELFPALRKFGISFYEFNPLGGGLFTGRYNSPDDAPEPGSRFDPAKVQGKNYRNRYWKEPYFQALAVIRKAAEKHNLSLPEVALRWLSHHSYLSREHGDAVLIGASSVKHIEQNLIDLEKGPLPDEVVKALDEAWLIAKPHASSYFREFN
ncbi:Aflatoxin B1 aldehyde reductase member 3 [Hypsizygus marmoreus]|uniref:Aflatoxin B1 aldehyde reductase member 3 n=1 Tax=Hypsizygus marmoreus TaxID=39966 RepID=A0A369JXJ2_HYPMA|nr:Aflatoxin B1 aldehyde reductase member 3 [Hypsizygus marmoreus]